jgi:hypothetical protein
MQYVIECGDIAMLMARICSLLRNVIFYAICGTNTDLMLPPLFHTMQYVIECGDIAMLMARICSLLRNVLFYAICGTNTDFLNIN